MPMHSSIFGGGQMFPQGQLIRTDTSSISYKLCISGQVSSLGYEMILSTFHVVLEISVSEVLLLLFPNFTQPN